MNWTEKLRPNAIIGLACSTLLFVGTGSALLIGAAMGLPIEVLLILAVAVGAAGVKTLDYVVTVSQDPPPPQAPESTIGLMLDKLRDWK